MYNVYFEAASTGFVAILLLYLFVEYPNASLSNIRFRKMLAWLLVSTVFDIVTAKTIDYGAMVPPVTNILLNTIFFFSSGMMGLAYVLYLESFIYVEKKSPFHIGCVTIFVLYAAALFFNMFFGYIFTFDSAGTYIHGPLYHLSYGILVVLLIIGLVLIYRHRRKLEARQRVIFWMFLVILVIGFTLQIIFFQHTLLVMYFSAIGGMIFLFTIETPDFQRLEATMAELEIEKERADAANAAKSTFLAKMSHEIRTPINAVIGMDEMILRSETSEEIRGYAFDIKQSAEMLLSTINDILDLSKVESGKMELIPVEYDTSSLFYDVVNMISFRAEEKGLDFLVALDEDIPSRLYGDDVRIRQILINILTNAVKYTQYGSVSLTVGQEQYGKDVVLHISVADTGIGIKEEDMAGLFAEYERLDTDKNRSVEGTGLGMNITRQLLTLMGSTLTVKSAYGKGSVFSFDLWQKIIQKEPIGDLNERIGERRREFSYRSTFYAPHARILIVDDNATNRRVLRALLRDTGVRIEEAESGFACMDMVKETRFDVILLDHMMPKLDGVETLKRLRENHSCDGTPVVALTANATMGAREFYKDVGFDEYLSKPIRPEKLEELLRGLLPSELLEEAPAEGAHTGDTPTEGTSAANGTEEKQEMELPAVEGLNYDYALLFLQDEGLLSDTISDFAVESIGDADRLEEYFRELPPDAKESPDASESLKQYRVLVHAMKNNAAMIGGMEVSSLAKVLEFAAWDGELAAIQSLHPIFIKEWRALGERIRQSIPTMAVI